MSANLSNLDLIIASPSDVEKERKLIKPCVEAWNRNHSKDYGIKFNPIMWEDLAPGIGARSQEVINEQLFQDPDVFLGILWSRIGTPTGKAVSGFVEEYEIALKKFKKEKKLERIVILIKDSNFPKKNFDPQQYQGVINFEKKISEDGVFYGNFKTNKRLEALVHTSLTKIAKQFKRPKHLNKKRLPDSKNAKGLKSSHTSDLGLLDYGEEIEKTLSQLIEVLVISGESIVECTKQMEEETLVLKIELAKPKPDKDLIKISCQRLAQVLKGTAKIFAKNQPTYIEIFNKLLLQLKGLIEISKDFDNRQGFEGLFREIKGLQESMLGASGGLKSFEDSLVKMPRMERNLNLALKDLIIRLRRLRKKFISNSNKLEIVVNSILKP